MDKVKERKNTVNGYVFGSDEDVALAEKELTAIKIIDAKAKDQNVASVLKIYQMALDKKVFRTPVGYAYLHELQKRLIALGVNKDDIAGIPLFQIYSPAKEEKVPREYIIPKKKDKYKRRNTILTLVNIILIILIIVMFAISFSGSSPNVINYRRALENEYSSWKQELDEREKAIKQKERELNLDYGRDEDISSR